MSREYIRIYCCGDCVHYDYKRHKCKRGAKDEGTGRERFYRDCPEKIYTEHDIKSMYTWSTDADKALDMAVYALREKERRKDEEGRRMKPEEAINYIIRHCNPDYPNGKTEWETAINMAITALEKQISIETVKPKSPYFKFACPSCGNYPLIGHYCSECGQAVVYKGGGE